MAVNELHKNVDRFYTDLIRELHKAHQYVGESFIAEARQRNTYVDKTANLRNSIGYIAVTDGETTEGFKGYVRKVSPEGMDEGKRTAHGERTKVKGMGLIMVAGMSYGAAVEAKGFDVISNTVNNVKPMYKKKIDKVLKEALKAVR